MEKIKDNEKMQKITLDEKQLFHIHTFRCGHAENISDEAYVTHALELGATDLWFSDHAPFPGDPFRSRMRYSQLNEYITTLDTVTFSAINDRAWSFQPFLPICTGLTPSPQGESRGPATYRVWAVVLQHLHRFHRSC